MNEPMREARISAGDGTLGQSARSSGATPDGRFTYQAAGDPTAPALIFLHGIGGSAEVWRGQVEGFSQDRRSIAWDMPGYGGSAALPEVTITALAGALDAFLAVLGIERAVIVGHSIGGMALIELSALRPERVRAAVLSATSAAFGRPDGDWQRAFLAARLGPLDRGSTLAELAPGIVAELVGDDPGREGCAVAERAMAAVPERTYRAMVQALIGFDRRDALAGIAVPCLVLAGEKDTNAPAAMMQRMTDRVPKARFEVILGAGHLANLERPRAFNAALRRFLDDLPRLEEGST